MEVGHDLLDFSRPLQQGQGVRTRVSYVPSSTSNKIVITITSLSRVIGLIIGITSFAFCSRFNVSSGPSFVANFLVKLEFFYHLISDCSYSTMNFRTFSLRSKQTIFLFQTLPVLSSTCSGGAISLFTSVVRFLATSTNCVSAATTLTQSPSRTRGFSCWGSKSQSELSCLWRSS